jgi:chromatin assembly factor 1 subunit B
MPYKMVYAIATLDSVVIYDTTSSLPLAAFCQIHFDSITDIRWSPDGSFLAVSSRDCFCSIISFEQGELGLKIDPNSLPPHIQMVLSSHHERSESTKQVTVQDTCKKDVESIQKVALQSIRKPASNSSEVGPEMHCWLL